MSATEPTIHNRLAAARSERGIGRAELAQAVGVTPQVLGYVELGKYQPDLVMALRICEKLGVPLEEVFSLHPFERDYGPRLM